jgi:hypothetical protein
LSVSAAKFCAEFFVCLDSETDAHGILSGERKRDGRIALLWRCTRSFPPHEVKLRDFMAWLDRNSRSPREMMNRSKIRELLGVKELR